MDEFFDECSKQRHCIFLREASIAVGPAIKRRKILYQEIKLSKESYLERVSFINTYATTV